MPTFPLPDLSPALPEIVLACAAMALLLVGVFRGEGSTRLISWLAVAVLIGTLLLTAHFGLARQVGFNGMFVTDAFAVFAKVLVLIGSAVSIIIALNYNEERQIARFEFPVLILLATTGMMVMVSANDLITLYLGLELQSLALYVVASFDRDSPVSGNSSAAPPSPRTASSSASCSSRSGSPSRCRRCRFTCGPPTSTKAPRRRSPRFSRSRQRSPRSPSSSAF
jgi:NADH-quinone oxidoreductase subunit N